MFYTAKIFSEIDLLQIIICAYVHFRIFNIEHFEAFIIKNLNIYKQTVIVVVFS